MIQKNIFLVLLSQQNLRINTIIMHLIFFSYYLFEDRELSQMLQLWSLYESDELRSAEWLGRNPGGNFSSWVIGLCSEVLLWVLMKNGIQHWPWTWEQLNVFEWALFPWLWTMSIPKLLKSVFSLTHNRLFR